MKEGYIVCNMTNCGVGYEIFGVHKNEKTAERHLRRVVRERFGKCPRDINDLVYDPYTDNGESSYQIIYFKENDG